MMINFNGAFGAYIVHQDEIERAIVALENAYNSGEDINDPVVANMTCRSFGINPSHFSNSDIQYMNQELERRLN